MDYNENNCGQLHVLYSGMERNQFEGKIRVKPKTYKHMTNADMRRWNIEKEYTADRQIWNGLIVQRNMVTVRNSEKL